VSWKLNNEVRHARLAGLLPELNFTEFSVLLIIADTCRGESRVVSISMTELEKLSGQKRTSMWRAVDKLIGLGHIRRLTRGNQFQAARYEVQPLDARCADATSANDARCADATSPETEHVALATEHVALATEHVALEADARCADATYPDISRENPDKQSRGGARAGEIVPTAAGLSDTGPPPLFCLRHPNGSNDPCGGCADARRFRQEWERLHPEVQYQTELNGQLAKMAAKTDAKDEYYRRRFGVDTSDLFGHDDEQPTVNHIPSERVVPETNGHVVPDGPECVVDGCPTPGNPEHDGMCGRHWATSQWGSAS
jgi:hypothetical protein